MVIVILTGTFRNHFFIHSGLLYLGVDVFSYHHSLSVFHVLRVKLQSENERRTIGNYFISVTYRLDHDVVFAVQ